MGSPAPGTDPLPPIDDGVVAPDDRPVFGTLPPRQRRRIVVRVVGHSLLVTALLLLVYFEVPIGRDASAASVVILVVGLVGFTVLVTFQVRRILDAPVPQLRAIETLATAVPLFVVIFALVYDSLAAADPGNFSEPLSGMGSLYFTITVLSTVGFGDITPVTDPARAIVSIQMLLDLVIVGVVVKLIMGASRIGVERRRAEAQARPVPPADDAADLGGRA